MLTKSTSNLRDVPKACANDLPPCKNLLILEYSRVRRRCRMMKAPSLIRLSFSAVFVPFKWTHNTQPRVPAWSSSPLLPRGDWKSAQHAHEVLEETLVPRSSWHYCTVLESEKSTHSLLNRKGSICRIGPLAGLYEQE